MGSYKWGDKGCRGSIGFRVVIRGVTILITHIRGLITPLITTLNPKPYNPKDSFKGALLVTPLITTHEPPSRVSSCGVL